VSSSVQTMPVRVRLSLTGRRSSLALILLMGAVGILLAYYLIPGQRTGDMFANEPALTVSAQTQSGGGTAQTSLPASTAGQVEADTRSNLPVGPAAAELRGSAASDSGQAHSADRVSPLPSPADAAEDGMANNEAALGGRAVEPTAPLADEVLHITNVGDRIIATRGAGGQYVDVASARSTGYSVSYGSNTPADDNQHAAEAVEPRPDYEDVYPGCPRVLPQGADEKMALERQQLYGCLYHESCATPVDDEPPYCTWHLIKML
jgi:hypothetical protein